MPKFVIQKHQKQGQDIHWDLMLEKDNKLRTFRVPLPPDKLKDQLCRIEKIFDHPVKFLNYEGSVNDGKGLVEIADSGEYRSRQINEGFFEVEFSGDILNRHFFLKKIKQNTWILSPASLLNAEAL